MSNDKLDKLPEGVYIDREAIVKETERIMSTIIGEIVENVRDQTRLVADIDAEYANQGIPLFIREQAAQRLGDILIHVSIAPTIDKLHAIMKDRLQDTLGDIPRE